MNILDDFHAARSGVKQRYTNATGGLLTLSLLGVALALILVALFVKSPLAKAGVLAWVTLP